MTTAYIPLIISAIIGFWAIYNQHKGRRGHLIVLDTTLPLIGIVWLLYFLVVNW